MRLNLASTWPCNGCSRVMLTYLSSSCQTATSFAFGHLTGCLRPGSFLCPLARLLVVGSWLVTRGLVCSGCSHRFHPQGVSVSIKGPSCTFCLPSINNFESLSTVVSDQALCSSSLTCGCSAILLLASHFALLPSLVNSQSSESGHLLPSTPASSRGLRLIACVHRELLLVWPFFHPASWRAFGFISFAI